MNKLHSNNLKLALQKSGRLADVTREFLWTAGLEFESYKQQLFSICRNFPLELLYVRDDDIPNYVASGTADIGIVGENIIREVEPTIDVKLDLKFGYCSLVVAVPKESIVKEIRDLEGAMIATTYPRSTKRFFTDRNIFVEIVQLRGSVEIAPVLGIASAIVDLTSTGSTLAMNDLRPVETVFESQAVLIANKRLNGNIFLNKIVTRFKAVLAAKDYKYVMFNAPKNILPEIKNIIPGLKSPTISPLAIPSWISVQTVIKEDIFWETIEKLKNLGAQGIIVLPIEKMIV